jgi:hypothetical protein
LHSCAQHAQKSDKGIEFDLFYIHGGPPLVVIISWFS